MSERKAVDKVHMDFVSRLAWGLSSRLENPGYGACERCGMSWAVVNGHTTYVVSGWGMFSLCLECKLELSPEERLPYCLAVLKRWNDPHYSVEELKTAVLNEVINDREFENSS